MEPEDLKSDAKRSLALARRLVAGLPDDDRARLLQWARDLLQLRTSNLPVPQKARAALEATARVDVALPLIRQVARQGRSLGVRSKRVLWDKRGWIARLGLAGASAGILTLGSQSAGIAALGGAVGVPLWLVLGAGGAVLGALVEELKPKPPSTTYTVIEAKRIPPGESEPGEGEA